MADASSPISTSVSVTAKALADGLIMLVSAGVAISSFLKDSHSYEVLFLSGLVLTLWLYIRKISSDVTDLRSAHSRCEKQQDDAAKAFNAYVEVTNVSSINMFGDLVAMAGQRRVGHIERDKETGAVIYIRNTSIPPVSPDGAERRGSLVASGPDPRNA